MVANLPGILLIVAGVVGILPQVDNRIAWALVAVAGVFMVLPM
jgi:hypothetical protein